MKYKNYIGYLLFILGLFLLVYSWIMSYPLTIDSNSDYLFRHIYPIYWLGFAVLNLGLFLMILTSKNKWVKIFYTFLIVMSIYSINFFYPELPGPDSHYFRGLTNYLIDYNKIDPNLDEYFQWPLLFVFSKIVNLMTNLDTNAIAYILFVLIGLSLTIFLYLYFSNYNEEYAFIPTLLYFISIYYFLNYQYAAQSLALVFLLALFYFSEKDLNKLSNLLIILLLFILLILTHAFFPIFYLLYLFFCIIFVIVKIIRSYYITKNWNKSKKEKRKMITFMIIFGLTFIVYLTYLFNFSHAFLEKGTSTIEEYKTTLLNNKLPVFNQYKELVLNKPATYNYLKEDYEGNISNQENLNIFDLNDNYVEEITSNNTSILTINQENITSLDYKSVFSYLNPLKIDSIAQTISRVGIISIWILLMIGFLIYLYKREIKYPIICIGLTGFTYMFIGNYLHILGERGMQLLIIPFLLGSFYFLTKFKKIFLIYLSLILIIITPLMVLHNHFDNNLYQTPFEEKAKNFLENELNDHQQVYKKNIIIVGKRTSVYLNIKNELQENTLWKRADQDINGVYDLETPKPDYIINSDEFEKILIKRFGFMGEEYIEKFNNNTNTEYNQIYSNKQVSISSNVG